MAPKILIVDDEKDIRDLLDFNLKREGYRIYKARDGLEALAQAKSRKPDLILLDIMLPHKDGFEVLRELQKNTKTASIPVIFLTARDNEIDEVVGLELGAEDYVVKPISIRTLVARVKKALRQTSHRNNESSPLSFDDITIDPGSFQVMVGEREVMLTRKEFEILYYLASRPGRVITRQLLLEELWDSNVVVIDRTIDVHIRKIREKIGPEHMRLIETIKGMGYRFKKE